VSFGSLPWRSSSASLASARPNSQSREDSFSAAAAILIRKKVASGTPRILKARTGRFFFEAAGAMLQDSTVTTLGKCACCEVVTFDTMYHSLLNHSVLLQGGRHGR
jgi:hypothetical protein